MSLKLGWIQPYTLELAALDQLKNLFLEHYSKYFNDLLSGERSLPLELLVSQIHHSGRDCKVGLFMRQFFCNAIVTSKLKYFKMIILDVFSFFSSVEYEFCIEEKFGIKLALVSISHVTIL